MSTVYQHQLHAHKTHRPHPWRWIGLGIAVVIVIAIVAFSMFKPDTRIQNARTTTRSATPKASTVVWRKGLFSITLPQGWTFVSEQKDIYDIFHFKSDAAGNRLLDIYQNSTLPNFAINRMIPVSASGDGRLTADATTVSDNCTAYTNGTDSSRLTGFQTAKWQDINFNCDVANPERNVVGIGSTDGLNTVKLSSVSLGPQRFFMAYTDHNIKPDYDIFAAVLNSFQVTQ